ncbi:MAG: spermidine synthase [Desulfobacterales bacterium]|nr:spermidine synthase [Desulfobacterales bacterium]
MNNLDRIAKGWFSEICDMWPGMALSIEIQRVLLSKKTRFQQIDLFQTKNHGKMLVLDGIIQLTEVDEFAYHEMMAHVPLFAHPNPKNVLVIGGGDGGVLREVVRHTGIDSIDFCEIDEEVIEVSKKFLPQIACGFDDPRINIYIEDGSQFIKGQKSRYDVIIVDSSDPIGPGEELFEKPFYQGLKKALKENGIIAAQGESFFIHKEYVKNLVKITKNLFPLQAYSQVIVPTYPGGHIGICLASLGPELKKPARSIPQSFQEGLKYYSSNIHHASFVLPYFAEKMIDEI